MSYNTRETSEIRVSSKIDRTALTETLLNIRNNELMHRRQVMALIAIIYLSGRKEVLIIFIMEE